MSAQVENVVTLAKNVHLSAAIVLRFMNVQRQEEDGKKSLEEQFEILVSLKTGLRHSCSAHTLYKGTLCSHTQLLGSCSSLQRVNTVKFVRIKQGENLLRVQSEHTFTAIFKILPVVFTPRPEFNNLICSCRPIAAHLSTD